MHKFLKKLFNNDLNYFYWKNNVVKRLTDSSTIIDTEKGKVEYRLIGDKGPVITSIHGAPGDWYQFYYICNGIPTTNYRILTWSRPGYLRTPIKSEISNEEQADLLASLLKELKINKTSIIAYSNGGPIALEFALKYKNMLDSLIMESPVVNYFEMLPHNLIKRYIDKILLNTNAGSWILYLSAKLFPNISSLLMLYRYGNYNIKELSKSFSELKHDYNNFLIMYEYFLKSIIPFEFRKPGIINDTVQSLKLTIRSFDSINIPVLIIHGTKDGDVSIDHSKHLSNKIKYSEFHKINSGTHLLSLTDAQKISDLKVNFLKEVYCK